MKNEVQEIQGLYGPYSLSERVLQKIWLRGDFDQNDLKTVSGKSLRILHPGRWNLLEGPDFLEARLEVDGEETVGDVEVHFIASDWELHGHSDNPNFARVCLHVLLYPEEGANHIRTSKGQTPESLCLMPLLDRDLEDYAIDDAIVELEQAGDAEWIREFVAKPLAEKRARLESGARERWETKLNFARKRLSGASWADACHQYCLEVLGYARNRAPMSRIALDYSIENFARGAVDTGAVFEERKSEFRLSGLRPANQPRRRLIQYQSICAASPDWPEQVRSVLERFEPAGHSRTVAEFRKASGLSEKLRALSGVFGNQISAKRLNTLICDALLPMAAADQLFDASGYWLNWPPGDAPDRLLRFLKSSEVIDRSNPLANGHVQGALQMLLKV